MSVLIVPKSIIRIVIDPNSKKIGSKRIQRTNSDQALDIQYPVVEKVTKQTLLIQEFDSDNGKALIRCRPNSKKTGEYTYLYYDRNHEKIEQTITSLALFDEGDEEIKVNVFLTC
ncbi:MAG: hypothetical protein PHT88_00695 [Candidatus Moranbacteria bacterium]|nr:hypothetical protein [Candidatus Moranbacteria bacterium]